MLLTEASRKNIHAVMYLYYRSNMVQVENVESPHTYTCCVRCVVVCVSFDSENVTKQMFFLLYDSSTVSWDFRCVYNL